MVLVAKFTSKKEKRKVAYRTGAMFSHKHFRECSLLRDSARLALDTKASTSNDILGTVLAMLLPVDDNTSGTSSVNSCESIPESGHPKILTQYSNAPRLVFQVYM